jgi:hypothetical protein
MKSKRFFSLAMVLSVVAARASAAELQSATVDAWQQYLRAADVRLQARLDSEKRFLWVDEAADRQLRVRRGEVVVAPLVRHGIQSVPNGLIHDWIGAVFIPNATLGSLLAVLRDYDRYKDVYKPAVTDSKCLEFNAADQDFSMTWQRHVLFVNAAMQARYRAHEIAIDSRRGYGVANATRIQQIEDYGRPSEHLLPADTGSGFIWRIRSISRYLERDGGVYLEIEAIALTRDIPSSLRWMVSPVVNHLSINSLTTTLSQTREAVGSQRVTLAMKNRKGQN